MSSRLLKAMTGPLPLYYFISIRGQCSVAINEQTDTSVMSR